jgi:hypothetical protein
MLDSSDENIARYDTNDIVINKEVYIDSETTPTTFMNKYLFYEKKLYYCYKEEQTTCHIIPYQFMRLLQMHSNAKIMRQFNKKKEETRLVVDKIRTTKPYIIPL